MTNTVTGDAPEASLADSTTVEPISAADEIDVEAAEVNSDAAKGNSDVVAAEDNFAAAGDNFNASGNVAATLSVKVVTTSAEAQFNASTHEADQANFDVAAEDNFDAAGDNCNAAGTAAAGAKATAGKANVELKATVVTVDASRQQVLQTLSMFKLSSLPPMVLKLS